MKKEDESEKTQENENEMKGLCPPTCTNDEAIVKREIQKRKIFKTE